MENTEDPVQVITDHKNLEYFMSSKLLNRRQARWSEFFSRFNFKIIYKPGSLNNKADVLTRQSGDIPKKGDNRRQFQWQTVLKKDNLDIQQLTLGPISDDDSDNSETVSNPDSIDDETFSEFPAIIDDAIWAAYAEDERTQEILNALNTNQRTLKKKLSETKLVDGRIYFRNRMFVPNVGQLRFRFIQKSHDDPAARHPGKTKTYEILNRYYYWPEIIDDVKRFVKNCYGCRKSKTTRDKYHGVLKPLPVPDRRCWSGLVIGLMGAS